MAQPEPKRWGQAALGGLLVALGGALFGAARGGRSSSGGEAARPAPKGRGKHAGRADSEGPPQASGRTGMSARPKAGAAKVRTKPRPPKVAARTRYWPPPAPKPIAPENGVHAAERDARPQRLPVDRASEKLGYEVKDAKAGTIAKVMAFSVGMIAISIASLFWFVGHSHRDDAVSPPLTRQQLAVIVPPGPHLQDHPLHDIALEKKRESDLLSFYAWSDPNHRTARIPIARAQALVIGRPLDPLPAAFPAEPAPVAPSPHP